VRKRMRLIGFVWFGLMTGCAAHPAPQVPLSTTRVLDLANPQTETVSGSPGVLVMAHGGSDAWDASVEAAIAPLAAEIDTEVAFGMADPASLQRAVDLLESAGVTRIAVVRLFISGDSFLDRTEYLFNKTAELPDRSTGHGSLGDSERIRTASQIEIDSEGLVDAFETGTILRSRARALSGDVRSEAVLLIGHGNGDEAVNERLLRRMVARTELIRTDGYREVAVETLREDWAEPRAEATRRIREWVADRTEDGGRVLVVPFRLSGFGPFGEVLAGLDYEADGLGLLPHDAITSWLRRRVQTVFCDNDWRHVAVTCPVVVRQASGEASGRR